MDLAKIEERLGEIYNLATTAQDYIRNLMTGKIGVIELTAKQKDTLKKAVTENVEKITAKITEIKTEMSG